jgi:hypothetical protein
MNMCLFFICMKKYVSFLAALLVFITSCQRPCDCTLQVNRVLLLKIDFQTHQFEGAFEHILSSPIGQVDTLPITSTFAPPGDFGNVAFHYQPTNELIFDGDIVWNGLGAINYPMGFDPPNTLTRIADPVALPDSMRFQNVFPEMPPYKLPLDSVWMDVADLKIVNDYMDSHKQIGYFLYTPSIGLGNPADWDWFLVLNSEH